MSDQTNVQFLCECTPLERLESRAWDPVEVQDWRTVFRSYFQPGNLTTVFELVASMAHPRINHQPILAGTKHGSSEERRMFRKSDGRRTPGAIALVAISGAEDDGGVSPTELESKPGPFDFIGWRRRVLSDRTWIGLAFVVMGVGVPISLGGLAWLLGSLVLPGVILINSGIRHASDRLGGVDAHLP